LWNKQDQYRVEFKFADLTGQQTAEGTVLEFASGGLVNGKLLLQNLAFIRDLMKDASRKTERSKEGKSNGRPDLVVATRQINGLSQAKN
jgi:hypothetical protein